MQVLRLDAGPRMCLETNVSCQNLQAFAWAKPM